MRCVFDLPIFCSPALHKTHADGAHAGQLVHRLEALVHRLSQECSELLVVEDLQITAWERSRAPLK